jgi:hypothetical protein
VIAFFAKLPPCLVGLEAWAVALANKLARIAWGVLARGRGYDPAAPAA